MKLSIVGASLSALVGGAMRRLGDVTSLEVRGPTGRQRRNGVRTKLGRSKYMPHIGAKEQERAKRCWMSEFHESGEGLMRYRSYRSAPTMCQSAKLRA